MEEIFSGESGGRRGGLVNGLSAQKYRLFLLTNYQYQKDVPYFFGKSEIPVMFTHKGKSLSEVPEIFKMLSMVFIILSLNIWELNQVAFLKNEMVHFL